MKNFETPPDPEKEEVNEEEHSEEEEQNDENKEGYTGSPYLPWHGDRRYPPVM